MVNLISKTQLLLQKRRQKKKRAIYQVALYTGWCLPYFSVPSDIAASQLGCKSYF